MVRKWQILRKLFDPTTNTETWNFEDIMGASESKLNAFALAIDNGDAKLVDVDYVGGLPGEFEEDEEEPEPLLGKRKKINERVSSPKRPRFETILEATSVTRNGGQITATFQRDKMFVKTEKKEVLLSELYNADELKIIEELESLGSITKNCSYLFHYCVLIKL